MSSNVNGTALVENGHISKTAITDGQRNKLLSFAKRRAKSRGLDSAIAEDAVQKASLKAISTSAAFEGRNGATENTWLTTIVDNELRTQALRKKRFDRAMTNLHERQRRPSPSLAGPCLTEDLLADELEAISHYLPKGADRDRVLHVIKARYELAGAPKCGSKGGDTMAYTRATATLLLAQGKIDAERVFHLKELPLTQWTEMERAERTNIEKAFNRWRRSNLHIALTRREFSMVVLGAFLGTASRTEARGASASESFDIVEFDSIKRPTDLVALLSRSSYVFDSRVRLTRQISLVKHPEQFLDLMVRGILEAGLANPKVAGLIANLTDKNFARLLPRQRYLRSLEALCKQILNHDRLECFNLVEPLSYALNVAGCQEVHQAFLWRAIRDREWRKENGRLIRQYHGPIDQQIPAVWRHISDQHRTGLRKLQDVPVVWALLEAPGSEAYPENLKRELLTLLRTFRDLAYDLREGDLSDDIAAFMKSFSSPASGKWR